jgi:acylaminoacyl-peptidase
MMKRCELILVYLECLASLSFAPTESAILYTAEGKTPETENLFEKFRFNPDFGEGLAGKKRPVTFIFHWNSSHPSMTSDKRKLALVELKGKENVRFGQAVFSPTSDNVIYATGYEFTSDGRILGLKYCANRPSGIWRLSIDRRGLPELDDKLNSATVITPILQKLTPASLSCRSPRTFEHFDSATLAWLACPTGGAHLKASALYCLDISTDSYNINSYLKTTETPLVPITNDISSAPDKFPGLFPSYNLPSSPEIVMMQGDLVLGPSIVLHSYWGSRTTVLLISTKDGSVVDLTPASKEEGLYSWTVLATDGESRVVCQRSSSSVPYEIYLGYFNHTGFVSWHLIDKPDLPEHSKLFSISFVSSIFF